MIVDDKITFQDWYVDSEFESDIIKYQMTLRLIFTT